MGDKLEQTFGWHYIIEFSCCNPTKISKKDIVENALIEAVDICGATYVSHHMHQFSPKGVSGVVLIAESHFSIHTWPESNYVAMDIFTCGPAMHPEAAIRLLTQAFEADDVETRVLERGLPE